MQVIHRSFFYQLVLEPFPFISFDYRQLNHCYSINNYNRSMAQSSFVQHLPKNHLSHLVVPLISKRLNNVEKYVSDFSPKAQESSRVDHSRKPTLLNRRAESNDKIERHHMISAQLNPYMDESQLKQLNERCCVKYDSVLAQKSQERIETLSRLQKDYNLLKEKMHPNKKSPKAIFSNSISRNQQKIAQEDVERELKTSIINQNGKKYFADLYLLKKGREEIMNSLSGAGKLSIQQEKTYEEKTRNVQHQFVKHKILQDRQIKRNKMLKGRNLHWNVYYDMLALSANQKKKLKGICKFTSTFGIV